MIISIKKQELKSLYEKAIKKYHDCVLKADNAFLKDEISIPPTSVILKYSNMKIVFSQEDTENYVFETTISLWDYNDKYIGIYIYIMDDTGSEVDDKLVFF
ncbi:MAG: hypothetical protein ACO1PI_04105 [Bacteroidota bacterium]